VINDLPNNVIMRLTGAYTSSEWKSRYAQEMNLKQMIFGFIEHSRNQVNQLDNITVLSRLINDDKGQWNRQVSDVILSAG